MPLEPGARLGPYEVVARLGGGGMGEVFRARDTRLGREVALKVLRPGAGQDAERLQALELEARAAGGLSHPNIIAVYDVGRHEEQAYVVSELLEGETLEQRLRRGPLPRSQALDVAVQVARALGAAHEKGIFHRDLKPANVFLCAHGLVKLLDFGLAKLERSQSVDERATGPIELAGADSGPIYGTVGYVSPEQVRGGEADARSDIFSFGVILHEMLSGRPPFRRGSVVETLHAILNEEPAPLGEGASPQLERVAARCLEKDPAARFQSARDLAFHLDAVSGFSRPLPLPRPSRARPRGVAARWWLLAALGAAALAGAFWAGRQGRPPAPSFQQLTFRRGILHAARFSPDGQSVVYAASWEGRPSQVYAARRDSPESRLLLERPASLLAVSPRGELAVTLVSGRAFARGTLARVPLAGGQPRELLEQVEWADWDPRDPERLALVRWAPSGRRLEFPAGRALAETAGWISHPRVSPDGNSVAFLEHPVPGDNRGSVMLAEAGRPARRLSGEWKAAWGLAWNPRTREVWFSASERETARTLYAVDARGRQRLVARLPLRLSLHDIAPDGRRLLLTHDLLRRSTQGVAPGDERERDLSWLDYSNAKDLSADGRLLLFSEDGEGGGSAYAVYLRSTDGAPAVRLGEGKATALSPDGQHALVIRVEAAPHRLFELPTGAGQPREVPLAPLERCDWAFYLPGGGLLLAGAEPGRAPALYVADRPGQAPRRFGGEGVNGGYGTLAVSPDGTRVAALGPGQLAHVYPLAGGDPQPAPGVRPREAPVQWSADGAALYLFQPGELPSPLTRVDLRTGQRTLVRALEPPDPSGVLGVTRVRVTPDGRAWAYTFSRILSDLILAEGLE